MRSRLFKYIVAYILAFCAVNTPFFAALAQAEDEIDAVKAQEAAAPAVENPATVPDVTAATTTSTSLSDEEIVKLALKKEWKAIADNARPFIDSPTEHSSSFLHLIAISLLKSGDNDGFMELLNYIPESPSRTLLRASHDSLKGGKDMKIPGFVEPLNSVDAYVLKKNKPKGSASLGILPKSTESSAIKKAFDELVPEPTDAALTELELTIETEAQKFFLGGEVLFEDEETVVCLAFVDKGKLKTRFSVKSTGGGSTTSNGAIRVGIVTKKGSDKLRKDVAASLTAAGYKVEDLGRGDFYALGDRVTGMNVVVELYDEGKVSGEILGTKFKNIDGVVSLNVFNAVTGKVAADMESKATVVGMDEFTGKEEAVKKSYGKISSKLVSSIAGIKESVKTVAGGAPPVEMTASASEVFASSYKYYATHPFGSVVIRNNTQKVLGSAELSFMIKEYMDYPTVIKVGDLSPGTEIRKDLIAVFGEKILALTDDSFLQSELKLKYYDLGKQQDLSTNTPIFVYEKHALIWDDKGKIASFITPKDPVVVGFAGLASGGYKDFKINKNIVKAMAVFNAMGVLGITYKPDPNNPFEVVSGLNTVIDYVQFPRETLTRKIGDCDDLTSLYASSLESMGIRTILIDAPGHVFMMFDTGVPATELYSLGFSEVSFVIHDAGVWVPIETTLSGFSFTEAWKSGLKNYNKWKKAIKLVDLNEARKTYKSPNLGKASFTAKLGMSDIEKKFPGELKALEKEAKSGLSKSLEDKGVEGLTELMILSAEKGELDKAVEYAKKLIETDGQNPVVLNNVANVYYLKKDFESAIKYYKDASLIDSSDAGILVNMARVYAKLGQIDNAKAAFDNALNLDPGIKDTYYGVYMEVYK